MRLNLPEKAVLRSYCGREAELVDVARVYPKLPDLTYDDLFDQPEVVDVKEFMAVEFQGARIGVLPKDGQLWVSIRGICKELGLDFASQSVKFHNDPKFTCCDITTRDSFGRLAEPGA